MWDDTYIRYLHISDLHFRIDKQNALSLVEKAFNKDLEKLDSNIDIIFITGDIAFSGKSAEYKHAAQWIENKILNKLNLDWDSVFLIPGNHDVDRSLSNNVIFEPLLASTTVKEYRDKLFKLWDHQPTREFIENKFSDFKTFVSSSNVNYPNSYHTSWARTFEKNGFRLSIIGANSAWAAGFDGDDKNKLIVGIPQLQEAYDKLPNTIGPTANFLLCHHPLEYLHKIDQRQIRGWVNKYIDFNLSGHAHELNLENSLTRHSLATWITSGAMFLDRNFSHSYNIVDIGPCLVRINLRRYGPSNEFYGADTLSYQEASETGILSWQWRRRPRIYIAGSLSDELESDVDQNVIREQIRNITVALLEKGISVWATSRVQGVGAEVWAVGSQWCREKGVAISTALGDTGLYPISEEFKSQIHDFIGVRTSYMVLQDAIMVFGGKEGTEQEIQAARNLDIPTIPIRWSGGTANTTQLDKLPLSKICDEDLYHKTPKQDWSKIMADQISKALWSDKKNLGQEKI